MAHIPGTEIFTTITAKPEYSMDYVKSDTLLLECGGDGAWDSLWVAASGEPIKIGTRKYMFYHGWTAAGNDQQIGMQYSDNGGLTWIKYNTTGLIFSPFGEAGTFARGSVSNPVAFIDVYSGLPKLIFTGEYGGFGSVGLATININGDTVTVTPDQLTPILEHGSVGDWNHVVIGPASILQESGATYVYYTAWSQGPADTDFKIGVASGTSLTTLSHYASNPILEGRGNGYWDAGVLEPFVKKFGLIYYMFFQGNNNQLTEDMVEHSYIGIATSTDKLTWTKKVEPIVTHRGLDKWDSGWNEKPIIDTVGTEQRLLFSGSAGSEDTHPMQTGYAVITGIDVYEKDLSLLDDAMWDKITTEANIGVWDVAGNTKIDRHITGFSKLAKTGTLRYSTGRSTIFGDIEQFHIDVGAEINETQSTTPFTSNNQFIRFEEDETTGTPIDCCGNKTATEITGTQGEIGVLGKSFLAGASGDNHNLGVISQLSGATKLHIHLRFKYVARASASVVYAQDQATVTDFQFIPGTDNIYMHVGGMANTAIVSGYRHWVVDGWNDANIFYNGPKSTDATKIKLKINNVYVPFDTFTGTIPSALPSNAGQIFMIGNAPWNTAAKFGGWIDGFFMASDFTEGKERARYDSAFYQADFWGNSDALLLDYLPQSEAGPGDPIDLTADTVYLLEHDLRLYGTVADPVLISSLTEGTKAYIDCNGFKIYSATGGVTLTDVEIINGSIENFPSSGGAKYPQGLRLGLGLGLSRKKMSRTE